MGVPPDAEGCAATRFSHWRMKQGGESQSRALGIFVCVLHGPVAE